MTIHELVNKLMESIRLDFYPGKVRHFYRDQRALAKAVARYGYECQGRGWELEADAIYSDISRLLQRIRLHRSEVEYLPTYLESAITQHICQRAEEIQAKSTNTVRTVNVVMDGLTPVARIVSTDCELLNKLHASLSRKKIEGKAPKQLSLL